MTQLDLLGGKSAVIDPTGTYRYLLTRTVGNSSLVALWIMLNPSTADANEDDATIRKICGFTSRWGYGRLAVVNLFALRSTDPRALRRHEDPVGPENDAYIESQAKTAETVICAWGNHGAFKDRDRHVRQLLQRIGRVPVVLGLNAGSERRQPVHPLYQPNTTQVSVWPPEAP